MRFQLLLHSRDRDRQPVLPFHYRHSISTAIHHLFATAATGNPAFSHKQDLAKAFKTFALFTFSDFSPSLSKRKNSLVMKSASTILTVALHLPEEYENLIYNLFINQTIVITNHEKDTRLFIEEVKPVPFLPAGIPVKNKTVQVLLRPLSPVCVGEKNRSGHYTYLLPDHPSFIYQLLNNWKGKYRKAYPEECTELIFNQVEIKYEQGMRPYRTHVIFPGKDINGEQAEGCDRFALHVSAPEKVLELAGNIGLGLYNDLGIGCIEAKPLPKTKRR